jgi:endonuclease/exonuclease/phosphatase family metal-dependent hydrolase
MTYNVYGARYRSPLRQVVRALSPDVLVVNETPKAPLLWRWQCDRLARSWAMRRAGGGRDAGSNMICVSPRVDVEWTTARRLGQPRFKPRRGIVAAQCSVDGVEFGVVGVHLSLLRWSRPTEAAAALADAQHLRGPVIVAGDFNERPNEPSWEIFRNAGFADHADPEAFTSQAATPHQRIDGLLVRGAQVLSHAVPGLPHEQLAAASDHLPIVASVVIDGDPSRGRSGGPS